MNAAELAKAAFGGESAGVAEAITDDHSMGETEENVESDERVYCLSKAEASREGRT